jgi:hypothetical protein
MYFMSINDVGIKRAIEPFLTCREKFFILIDRKISGNKVGHAKCVGYEVDTYIFSYQCQEEDAQYM